jgi:hypothetical protein
MSFIISERLMLGGRVWDEFVRMSDEFVGLHSAIATLGMSLWSISVLL